MDLRDTNRLFITFLTDNELMQLYYLAQEMRRGDAIKRIQAELSRRIREA